MRQSWRALGVALFALGLMAGCNDYNTSIQDPHGGIDCDSRALGSGFWQPRLHADRYCLEFKRVPNQHRGGMEWARSWFPPMLIA